MVIIWRCKYNCTLNNNIKTNVPENFTHRWCDTDTDCPRFLLKHTIQDQGEHWCANGFARCFYMDAKKPPLFFFFFDTATIALQRTTTLFAATTTTIHGSQYSAKILVVTAKASRVGVNGRRNSAVEKKSSTGCHTHTTIQWLLEGKLWRYNNCRSTFCVILSCDRGKWSLCSLRELIRGNWWS